MMAGVYAVQGAWWPLLAVHLADLRVSGRARGWIFASMALAALATPLGAGQVADRLMATQRLLSLLYAMSGSLLLLIASGWITDERALFGLFLVYWLITAPGLGLCSAMALRNLERPSDQFGQVRVWGTIGWMTIGWVVSAVMFLRGTTHEGQGAFEAFWVGSAIAFAFSLYCLTLPHTPPLYSGGRRVAIWDGGQLLSNPRISLILLLSFGVSLTTPFVYQVVPAYLPTLGLPRPWIASAMTLGQIPEIAALVVLPRVLGRLGFRGTMALGIAAWVTYYLVLSSRPPLVIALLGLPINGLAIAFFHVAGPMYLDAQAPPDRRASVQGLYLMFTTGLGMLIGSLIVGEILTRSGGARPALFLVPCAVDAILLVVLLAGFRPDMSLRQQPIDVAVPRLRLRRMIGVRPHGLTPKPGQGP